LVNAMHVEEEEEVVITNPAFFPTKLGQFMVLDQSTTISLKAYSLERHTDHFPSECHSRLQITNAS